MPNVSPGDLLVGKYRVERTLGEGGMGIVVAATNVALGTRVAIKLLRPEATVNAEALGRFEREARAAATLRSEHVARALDIGSLPDGRPYMVMEYLEGQDLGDFIEKGPQTAFHDAVDFVLQACEAIAEAHGVGIIHRDLKPKNLFLTRTVDGRPQIKVLDFGISKIEGPAQEMRLTKTTEVIGSPSYMSPEQLRASRFVDTRTDIWALGVILYELLTKRLPFYANTVTELVAVVLMEREAPVRSFRPDVPEGLEAVIARALAKRLEDRFGSVAELAFALAPYASAAGVAIAERVRGVAIQSGKLPPDLGSSPGFGVTAPTGPSGSFSAPPAPGSSARAVPSAASSSRVNVHGGTSVAWGETQVDTQRKTGSGAGRIAVAIGVLVCVAGAATGGTLWYVKRASARSTSISATPPSSAEPLPLPPGRKDLPPLDPPPASGTNPASPVPTLVGLPDTRKDPPARAATTATATAKPGAPIAKAATKPLAAPPSAAPNAPDDPLSNIGRR